MVPRSEQCRPAHAHRQVWKRPGALCHLQVADLELAGHQMVQPLLARHTLVGLALQLEAQLAIGGEVTAYMAVPKKDRKMPRKLRGHA